MNVIKTHEFSGHVDCIYTAIYNEDTHELYTSGGDGVVASWDCMMGGDGVMQAKVNKSVYSMGWFGRQLILGTSSGNIHLINLDTRSEERNIEAHTGGIFDIVIDETQDRIYTASADGCLKVWNLNLELMQTLKVSEKSIRKICVVPGYLVLASSDFNIYVLEAQSLKLIQTLSHHQNSVFALAYNPKTRELLSGGRDCYLKIWNVDQWALKSEYVGATLHINHLVFNPGNTMYALSSMDKSLKIFDAITHEPLKFITREKHQGHTSSVNKAIWISSDTVVTVSDDKKVMVWVMD